GLGEIVVEAVEAEIPLPLQHRLTDFREVLEDGEVDVDGATDPMSVEHVEHPPETHAVSVVAERVGGNVRRVETRPAYGDAGRRVLVVLDVWNDPECDPRVVGPAKSRTPGHRAVIDAREQ